MVRSLAKHSGLFKKKEKKNISGTEMLDSVSTDEHNTDVQQDMEEQKNDSLSVLADDTAEKQETDTEADETAENDETTEKPVTDAETDTEASETDGTDTDSVESDNIIDCDSLVKIYKTDEVEVMALQGLELTIKKGELMAVIGKSGSGKSTLLNMIGGLERPTAGKLYVDGKDLFAMTDKELVEYRKHTVGFVWQKNSRNLLPYMTALENVQVPMYFDKDNKADREKKAYDLLCKVGLKEKVNSYPSQMSGGEQQRVAIAIALANDPKILLADEPTGAVDSKTSDMIQDLFRKLNEELGITVIIVTHDISLANKVSRVVMIADGKISTEKIMKEDYRKRINDMEGVNFNGSDSHEEYSVLDKAHRVQISDDILEAAGIDTNKVKIQVVDGKVVISKE
ncbi:ABC transporter, ATP-binding protein [Clostridium sp. L2-50]|jgi:ABC-type lipoprotein export system ATPase subunit|nr:ABC transporter, ATP-binding protein [Clostridium sp. L2-50]